MLSILLVDTIGGELHQLLFASFADESTPAPKNHNLTINENKIYLQRLDLRHTCTKGFDPGVQHICQQHLFSLPIICKANYKLTFRSLEAMD